MEESSAMTDVIEDSSSTGVEKRLESPSFEMKNMFALAIQVSAILGRQKFLHISLRLTFIQGGAAKKT
jgi:hypothetical protein